MEKIALKKTVLKAPRSLKDARYIAETLALSIECGLPEGRKNPATRFTEHEGGFSLRVIMVTEDGTKKWCPVFKYTKLKGGPGPSLEYDERIVRIG